MGPARRRARVRFDRGIDDGHKGVRAQGAAEKLEPPVPVSGADLQRIVEEADLGGRRPAGLAAKIIFAVAVAWSLFQLWFASPLPFVLNIGILNDTQARAIHLALAFFLVFLCYPAFKKSSRKDNSVR